MRGEILFVWQVGLRISKFLGTDGNFGQKEPALI